MIEIQFTKIKSLTKEKFKTVDLYGDYKIDKTGRLFVAVNKKVEKTKEEMLSDYTEAVLGYDKLTKEEKDFIPKPKKEKYKIVYDKWQRWQFDGPLHCENSSYTVVLQLKNGVVDGVPEIKRRLTLEDLPKPLKETIVILKNGKPSLRVVFFTKTAFKWMEETLKINKLKYRWEK